MKKPSELSNDEVLTGLRAGTVLVWAEPRDFPADHRLWIERLGEERSNFDAASNPARKSELLFSRSAVPHLYRQWKTISGLESLTFNIAHTKDRFVAAFSIAGSVGVDLERVDRDVNVATLERIASPSELEWLSAHSNAWERLKLWCLKEAAVKSHRGGMWIDGASWSTHLPITLGKTWVVQRNGTSFPALADLVDSDWILTLVCASSSASLGSISFFRWIDADGIWQLKSQNRI